MSETDHGSASTYTNHGCRCQPCKDAWTEYNKGARARRTAAFAAGEVKRPHGVYSTYVNYGCRCDKCKAANAKVAAARVKASAE